MTAIPPIDPEPAYKPAKAREDMLSREARDPAYKKRMDELRAKAAEKLRPSSR